MAKFTKQNPTIHNGVFSPYIDSFSSYIDKSYNNRLSPSKKPIFQTSKRKLDRNKEQRVYFESGVNYNSPNSINQRRNFRSTPKSYLNSYIAKNKRTVVLPGERRGLKQLQQLSPSKSKNMFTMFHVKRSVVRLLQKKNRPTKSIDVIKYKRRMDDQRSQKERNPFYGVDQKKSFFIEQENGKNYKKKEGENHNFSTFMGKTCSKNRIYFSRGDSIKNECLGMEAQLNNPKKKQYRMVSRSNSLIVGNSGHKQIRNTSIIRVSSQVMTINQRLNKSRSFTGPYSSSINDENKTPKQKSTTTTNDTNDSIKNVKIRVGGMGKDFRRLRDSKNKFKSSKVIRGLRRFYIIDQ